MDVKINVAGQKLRVATNLRTIVSGSKKFVRFEFNLGNDWDSLTKVCQFKQSDGIYNRELDEGGSCYLPVYIVQGKCEMILYGESSDGDIIATTDPLSFTVIKNKYASSPGQEEDEEGKIKEYYTKEEVNVIFDEFISFEEDGTVTIPTMDEFNSVADIVRLLQTKVSEMETGVSKLT